MRQTPELRFKYDDSIDRGRRVEELLAGMPELQSDEAEGEGVRVEGFLTTAFLADAHTLQTFDFVVANPPFSAKAWAAGLTAETKYGRFDDGEPPAKNGDFAFLLHGFHYLKDDGVMAIILPHGVLFRGNAEGTIRECLIKELNYLDAVIGLPANVFYGTSIPTCILVLSKCRVHNDDILFIDERRLSTSPSKDLLGIVCSLILTSLFS